MKYIIRLIKVTVAFIAISSLISCVSNRSRSEQLFEQYCHEEGRVGQFIYERVALGEEFFRPIPSDAKALRYVNEKFYIDKRKLLIDKQHFKQSYTLNNRGKTILSKNGPIYSVESTIVRNSDGKVLSKAVSLLNMLDKTSKYFPVEGVTCPSGRNLKGDPISSTIHFNLIKKTFISKNKI